MLKNNLYSFFSLINNVGKSVLILVFALIFSKQNKKVLLIDLDSKLSLTKYLTKVVKQDNIYKYLQDSKDIKNIISKNVFNNIDLISSGLDTAYLFSSNWNDIYLEKLSKLFHELKNQYDYIFIDLSNLENLQNKIILSLSDYIIWPIKFSKNFSKEINNQLKFINLIKTSFNSNLKIRGVLVNFFDKKDTLMMNNYCEIVKIFNDRLFDISIPYIKELENIKSINDIDYLLNNTNQLLEVENFIKDLISNKEKVDNEK